MSDLLENIVHIVDAHHLENGRCISPLVESTEYEHVFDAFDPYHLFPLSLQAIISTEVLNVWMMKCTIHLLSFWSTSHGCTRASE